jgi:hypothetical protein
MNLNKFSTLLSYDQSCAVPGNSILFFPAEIGKWAVYYSRKLESNYNKDHFREMNYDQQGNL